MKRKNNKPAVAKKDLRRIADSVFDRVDALGNHLRQTLPRTEGRWAETAVEGLHTALEELAAAQDALADARNNAEEERTRYLELFSLAPDGYLVTDAYGKVLEANHAAAELLSVPLRWLPAKPMIVYVHGGDPRLLHAARSALRPQDLVE